MNNIELTNFNFVDRDLERSIAKDFLGINNNCNLMLVLGRSNVGKSFFIDKVLSSYDDLKKLKIDFNNVPVSQCAYKYLIEEFNKFTNGDFAAFIQKQFSNVIRIINGVASPILVSAGQSLFASIMDNLSDTSLFLKRNNEQESVVSILHSYIKKIIKKDRLIVVFKNFSKCDDMSQAAILNLISLITKENGVKFVVSIDTDVYNNSKLQTFLTNNLFCSVNLQPFSDPKYFYDMLTNIFIFKSSDIVTLNQVFDMCEGYPGNLKSLLTNIYMKENGFFDTPSGKMKWNSRILEHIPTNNLISEIQWGNPIHKLIFLTVLFLKIPLNYDDVVDATEFLMERMHMHIPIDLGALMYELLYNFCLLSLKNDIVDISSNIKKDLYFSMYENDDFAVMLFQYIYQYLKSREAYFIEKDKDIFKEQLAWHSYKSKSADWDIVNIEIGKYFYEAGNLVAARNIFSRIMSFCEVLNIRERYMIASCFYECGDYESAENVLLQIEDIAQYDFHYLLLSVKILNINMKKTDSVNLIDCMLHDNRFDASTYYLIDMKQRILSNLSKERSVAKKLFDKILAAYKEGNTTYDDFLISAMEYYRGDVVQECFSILEKKYIKQDNQLMLQELYVNKGFDLFWQGKIDDAKKVFELSAKKLEKLRTHEAAYALNNYANCLMMEGDVSRAIATLLKGLSLNQSYYAEITLKTNLMICYSMSKDKSNEQMIKKLFTELETMISNTPSNEIDLSILLKVQYAIGLVQETNFELNLSPSINYKQVAIGMVHNYINYSLPYLWFKNLNSSIEEDIAERVNSIKYKFFYKNRFEPWLLTLTHD